MMLPLTMTYDLDRDMVREGIMVAMVSATKDIPGSGRPLMAKVLNWIALFAVCVALFSLVDGVDPMVKAAALVGLGIGVLGTGAYQMWSYNRLVRHLSGRFAARGPWTTTLTEDDVTMKTPHGHDRLVWHIVDDVRDITGGTVLIFHGNSLIVPDTALPDDVSPQAFRDALQRLAGTEASA